MTAALRLAFLAAAVTASVSALAFHSTAGATTGGNAFEATFVETNVSITNRIPDLGIFQLINTGTGSVEGYGPATVVLAMSQDRSVHPCGAGSWTNAGLRRIVLEDGVLIMRELAYVCPTASGLEAFGTWTVDGDSSTGAFAGAKGSGEARVVLATRTATYTGKLKLANG